MPYNPLIHNRNSIRLQGYDYASEGAYFLTICTYQNHQLFGKIENDIMLLKKFGQLVRDEWEKSTIIRAEIELGEYVIMPNHMHAIVFINKTNCTGVRPNAPNDQNTFSGLKPKTIGSLIAGFKSSVTKKINLLRNSPGKPIWHRNYWEHIIRDDESFDKIVDYINTNPINWRNDQLFKP